MSANVFGNRYSGKKQAWHMLGTVFGDQAPSLEDALALANVDHEVQGLKLWMELPTGDLQLCEGVQALARTPVAEDPYYRFLSSVTDQYKIVSNQALINTFAGVTDLWPVESVAVLDSGKILFFTFDAGLVEIGNGDMVHQYFAVIDERSGRSATKCIYTPVRIVCQNTLTSGLAAATLTLNIPHISGNIKKLNSIGNTITDMQRSIQEVNSLFNGMANTPFGLKDFKETLLKNIYPDPEVPQESNEIVLGATDVTKEFERMLAKAQATRAEAVELYQMYADTQPNPGTKWSAWQVITDLEDHRPGRSNQYRSMIIGERAQTKAKALDFILNA